MKQLIVGLSLLLTVSAAPVMAATAHDAAPAKKTAHSVHKKSSNAHRAHHNSAKYTHSAASTNASDASGEGPEVGTPSSLVFSDEVITRLGLNKLPLDYDVPGQAFVSTGPYIGVPFMYSGNDLIINSPNINEDVILLNMRKKINQRLAEMGRPHTEDRGHLLLSGIVEATAMYKHPGAGSVQSDIDLTSAEMDGYILGPSNWTSGLFTFAYDNNIGADEGSLSSNARSENSRLFVDKAFIIIGNFEKSPFYGTAGQMYVPFGTYSTNMTSSPLTKLLGRTKERALLIGYQQQAQNAFYASGYIYKGDTHEGSTSRVNSGGINVGYRYNLGFMNINGDFGGGIIANLADAIRMQNTGNKPLFGGFGATGGAGSELIHRRVPAINLRGLFSMGTHVTLLAEYIGATTNFSPQDLTFNTLGANPQAFNGEAAYTFEAFDRPTTIAIGYSRTKDALALGFAWQRYMAVINTSWWKNTLQSLEFRHDINYPSYDYATGSLVSPPIYGAGSPDNAVTAQFDIYF